ncbi:MAG: hypothetical protein GX994_04090 [Firmicutes bacterium]|nr:hypothetical protein [Bacillota bacterium]
MTLTQLIRIAVYAKLEDEAAPIRREYQYYKKCICDQKYFKETRILGVLCFFKDLYLKALKALLQNEITIGSFAVVFASIGLMFSIMEEIVCRLSRENYGYGNP